MYHRILVPVDGSETSQRGAREAIALAADQKAVIHFLHVIDTTPLYIGFAPGAYVQQTIDAMMSQAEELVTAAKRQAADAGVESDSMVLDIATGRVADQIVNEAGYWKADLIVMGTHGRRGWSRVAMGSDAEIVARLSPVPVLLVRPAALPA